MSLISLKTPYFTEIVYIRKGAVMKRTDLEKLISLYIDGEVNDKTAKQVAHLIDINQEAAAIHSTFMKIREQIAQCPRISLPSDFSKTVLEKINHDHPVQTRRSRVFVFCKKNRALVCSIASIALLILILPLFVLRTSTSDPGTIETIASAPVIKTDISEPLKKDPLAKDLKTAVVSAPIRPVEETSSSILEIPIAYAPVPVVQKVDPSTLSLSVFCTLNEAKKDKFYLRFQDLSSELGLGFNRKSQDGKTFLEFHLTRKDLEKLVYWLESRTDYIASLQFSEPLKNWQQSKSPADLYDAAGKDLKKTVRFEIVVK